jgi:hypothetical protein
MRIVFLKCLFAFFFSCKCRFSTSDGFPLSLQILYFDLEFEVAVLISDAITELTANGNDYKGEENVVNAFQDHFRKLATFSLQDKIDLPYHDMVEEDIEILDVGPFSKFQVFPHIQK